MRISLGCVKGVPDVREALGSVPLDLVFCQPLSLLPQVRESLMQHWPAAKLVYAWTDGWPERIGRFEEAYSLADAVVINSLECWEKLGRRSRTYMIPNGVDLEIFRVCRPIETRSPKVLWLGSELARDRKGYDDFLVPLARKLRDLGIPADFRLVDSYGANKMTAAEMVDWYNTGTVLVCASRTEGTPNITLEAAACGCTVVSTPVGNMPQLLQNGVNGYLVSRDVDALLEGVTKACAGYPRLAARMQTDIQAWHSRDRAAEYCRAFRDVLQETRLQP